MTPTDTVVAAVDLSEDGRRVAEVAASFARAAGAKLRLVHVSGSRGEASPWQGAPEIDAAMESYRARLRDRVEAEAATLEELRLRCDTPGLSCEAEMIEGRPWEAIVGYVAQLGSALLVVGSHASGDGRSWRDAARGLTGRLLGTTADKLVRYAPCPVVVACTEVAPRLDLRGARWLVGVDLSPPSLKGLDLARGLAERAGGELVLLHVVPPLVASEDSGGAEWSEVLEEYTRREAALRMDELSAQTTEGARLEQVEQVERVALGSPADELCRAVDDLQADVLVIGTHGRKGVDRFLLGSTAERCLRQLQIPVLVTRAEE